MFVRKVIDLAFEKNLMRANAVDFKNCSLGVVDFVEPELVPVLREVHGVCIDPLRVLQETDELYTVTHENNIVACVFIKTVDWCVAAKPNIVTSTPYSHPEDDGNQMLRFCGVRALSVSPQHRRLGLASRLLELIKEKAAADRMLWIELHVDEKKDNGLGFRGEG
jgi:GNAT superfamily N-acetyltransferase